MRTKMAGSAMRGAPNPRPGATVPVTSRLDAINWLFHVRPVTRGEESHQGAIFSELRTKSSSPVPRPVKMHRPTEDETISSWTAPSSPYEKACHRHRGESRSDPDGAFVSSGALGFEGFSRTSVGKPLARSRLTVSRREQRMRNPPAVPTCPHPPSTVPHPAHA